jgi:hypothetical protein
VAGVTRGEREREGGERGREKRGREGRGGDMLVLRKESLWRKKGLTHKHV